MGGKGLIILISLLPLINFFYISDYQKDNFCLDSFTDSFHEFCIEELEIMSLDIVEYERNAVMDIMTRYRYSLINTNINELTDLIVNISKKHEISPKFIASVISIESSFNSYAVSHMNARGLMQITPETGIYLNNKYRLTNSHKINLFDDELNIELGVLYIRELLERYGNTNKAMAAYNFGPGRIDYFISQNRNIPTKYYNDISNVLHSIT